MAKVLIVDDEINIRDVIVEYIKEFGFNADTASNGEEAVQKAQQTSYDLIIMDLMMPVLDGFSATKAIKAFSSVPIIILSARFEEADKLYCFELGVDDYIVKPFSFKELVARMKSVLNRHSVNINRVETIGTLVIDYDGKTISIDQERIVVTPKEFELLVYLLQHKNQAVSREMLLEKVWDYHFIGGVRTVDTHIKMLRKNLRQYRDLIVTVRGTGYKLEH
ncbi:MAG: response regulator transcription factor [Erysipelothrix sp.]|nr:response regulator transcription factor [Erysipelothrix sp.]